MQNVHTSTFSATQFKKHCKDKEKQIDYKARNEMYIKQQQQQQQHVFTH